MISSCLLFVAGHAALFMVYSVMDCKTSKILASELVKVSLKRVVYCFSDADFQIE